MQVFYWLLSGSPDYTCKDERSGHQYTSCKIGSHHIQCALSVSASFTSSSYERDHNDCLWIIKPASILCPVVPWATMYLPSEIKWTVHLGKTIGITPVLIKLWDFFFLLLDVAGLGWKLTPYGNLAKFDEFYWYSPHRSGHTGWRFCWHSWAVLCWQSVDFPCGCCVLLKAS